MKSSALSESISLLEQQAVKAAINGAWDQAISLNQKILKIKNNDIPSLNRLAKAFWEKNNLPQAKKAYQKVLKVDPHNLIASKNLARLADRKKNSNSSKNGRPAGQKAIFVEEPGKTKLVKLIRLASAEILSRVNNADEVSLSPKKHAVSVTDSDGVYLGTIPDDLSFRLVRLIKGGNQYQVFVKVVGRQNLEIFIKEIKQTLKFRNFPSFTTAFATQRKGRIS